MFKLDYVWTKLFVSSLVYTAYNSKSQALPSAASCFKDVNDGFSPEGCKVDKQMMECMIKLSVSIL